MDRDSTYQIGWFSTGRDKAARDLLRVALRSIERGELKARICFVFSNRERNEGKESDAFFRLVDRQKLTLVTLSSRRFKETHGDGWRARFDREAMRMLERFHPDLCVLAGYMLIVGEEMCLRYPMINLHPALPGGPVGAWQDVIWKVIEENATETGVMMHLVTPDLDKGPPVTYCRFSLRGKPFDRYWQELESQSVADIKDLQSESNSLFREIRKHGLAREFPLILATLKAFSEGRVRILDGRLVDASGKPAKECDLTEEIERGNASGLF